MMNDHVRQALTALVHGEGGDPVPEDARELFGDELFAPAEGLDHEQHCRLTYRRLRRLGERVPPASKLLADPLALFALLERCAVSSPSLFLGMTVHTCLSLGAVCEFGAGRDDLGEYIAELDTMSSFGALLVTEAGVGNSHVGIRTEAVYEPEADGFVLHTPDPSAAKFMPNVGLPGVPKLGVVYAQLLVSGRNRGVFPFVLPIRDADGPKPGISITPLPETPFMPLDYASIVFDRVRLPVRALLHDSARLSANGQFHDPLGGPEERLPRSLDIRHRAWAASASALAAAIRASAAMAVRFAHERITLSRSAPEQPVIAYRSQQLPLFEALATAYVMTSLVNRVKRIWAGAVPESDDPCWSPGQGFHRTIGLAKAVSGWAAERVAAECGQRCGAHGMFAANRFAGYQGLGHILGPAAGDSYLIVLESAKAMAAGTAYQPPPGIVQASRRDVSALPVAVGLIGMRERGLHAALAGGMRTAVRRGQPPFEAWNNRSWLARELVETHVTRLALESLITDIATLPDPGAAQAVLHLAEFVALRDIRQNSGWYLSEEVLTPAQVRAIPASLNRLCEQIAPQALTLASVLLPEDMDLHAVAYPTSCATISSSSQN
jgi:acyl-CoA oxidase